MCECEGLNEVGNLKTFYTDTGLKFTSTVLAYRLQIHSARITEANRMKNLAPKDASASNSICLDSLHTS